jgi:hypothetical protein
MGRRRRGMSPIVAVIFVTVLAIVAALIIGRTVISNVNEDREIAFAKTALFDEKMKVKFVSVDQIDSNIINVTFCCASGTYKKVEITGQEVNELDIGLVIDRSGSMEQSGWTLNFNEGISPYEFYKNINVPKDDYSSYETFNVNSGTERLAVLLDWDRITGYVGSEGSEFALNLRNPSGTWIFGSNRPNVGGIVDPPDSVGTSDEYFSGISTKPQIVYIENPQEGNWRVKVYGWNLRPRSNPPNSQDVNVSVYIGDSSQIIRNPTIISLDAAKDAAKDFINDKRGNEQMNYVVFGSYGELKQTLTSDQQDLLNAVDDTGKEGGTAIQTGIKTATNNLIQNGRQDSDKLIVVLTDGQNDLGPDIAIQEANNTKNQGIEIFTIGLTGFVDEDMLKEIASYEDYYFYAPDASALGSIFGLVREKIIKKSVSTSLSDKFKIVFYNDTSSYITEISKMEPLVTKTFTFNLNGKITEATYFEVYPVIITDNGKDVIGGLIQTYYFRK